MKIKNRQSGNIYEIKRVNSFKARITTSCVHAADPASAGIYSDGKDCPFHFMWNEGFPTVSYFEILEYVNVSELEEMKPTKLKPIYRLRP